MKKRIFYTELSYLIGIIVLAFGTALMEKADFGVSMVVAPAYLLHLKISEFWPWFSFGMAEYLFQAFLLVLTSVLMKKVKKGYFFSFVTAMIYGALLDLFIKAVSSVPTGDGYLWLQCLLFAVGITLCGFGVALLFHTYISPEAYEVTVKEISTKWGFKISKVKTVYDLTSCFVSVILSFAFFGLWHFEGVYVGTFISAFLNGLLINTFSHLLESHFEFKDGLNFRRIFEE